MIVLRRAVLIIHGFAGGTYDQEELAFFLQKNPLLDVYQVTLPGHDKRSFKTIKNEEWIKCCEKKVDLLINYGYNNIYLVGHSMGGVIASYLATKYEQIKKLVLVSPAFNYITMQTSDKVEFVKGGINLIKNNEKDEILTRFLKLPLSSINEFKKLINKYKNSYENLRIPTLIIHGDKDSVVPLESSKQIYERLNTIYKDFKIIENASHDIFNKCDTRTLKHIERFFLMLR
ncbi:MAG: alpha/beta fold hydrolase [bacterium]|nr:alpha/beta fold hydrolase [bacterium]